MPRAERLVSAASPTKRGLRAWIRRSILNRLTAVGMGATALLLLSLALVAFPLFYLVARSNNETYYRNHLDRAAELVRFRATAVVESLQQLARNSFVVNAFVDSTGRELYLLPTLRDYRAPFGLVHTLTLLDSNLTVFVATQAEARVSRAEEQLARQALVQGRAQFVFDDVPAHPHWLVAIPVFYPPASAHEGVLLAAVDVQLLLQPALASLDPADCLTVSHEGAVLLSTACNASRMKGRVSTRSALTSPPETDLAVDITFADTDPAPFGMLSIVGLAYLALAALVLFVVFVATRAIGRPFAGKLEELARTADELAADPNASSRVRWDHPDEIGRLTQAFDALVEKWREIQASLELRVDQRTEQLAQALDQARESSRAKSEFLAVMSHEIRTPMNGVVGLAGVLRQSNLTPYQADLVDTVRESSFALLGIIDDLLDFSRVEAGKLTLEMAPLRVDMLVQDLVAALQPVAQARGIELRLRPLAADLSDPVIGDATRLRQVLTNLVHNAVKFTQPGGHVQMGVTAEAAGPSWSFVFEVSDSGIGIEASQLQRIFEPFEQGDRSTTRRYGGTGLGLAIVKRLVGLMGGSIDVDSAPGKGSHFTLGLALDAAPPPPAAETPGPGLAATPLDHLRVLVAEDNVTNQIVAKALLDTLGVRHVTIVENGREAVDVALRESFDLVLMDIQMPVMDGGEATAVLRRQGVKTPIVAMTANVLPADVATYIAAGMNDSLPKPMDRSRLLELLVRLCAAAPRTEPEAQAVSAQPQANRV